MSNRGMDTEDVGHADSGILLSSSKHKNATGRNVDGPKDCHTESCKSDTESKTSYDIAYCLYVESKKKG